MRNTSGVDDDGIRTTARAGRAAVSARVLGIVLVGTAIAVIALSAAAVWWLRRDPGVRNADEVVTSDAVPAERIAAHAVRPIVMQPTPAAGAQHAEHQTNPAPRAASARNVTTAPGASGATAPAPAAGSGVAADPAEESDAQAARVQQRDDHEIAKTAQDVINGMRAAGETKGLAAIPPPGTNPVKSGVIVPKDFELPEGYIRHYQTTDDGKRLEPILMFSPDYEFVDDKGKPIPLPEDGIVPPEMAPPGMPVRKLDVPATAHPTTRGDSR